MCDVLKFKTSNHIVRSWVKFVSIKQTHIVTTNENLVLIQLGWNEWLFNEGKLDAIYVDHVSCELWLKTNLS